MSYLLIRLAISILVPTPSVQATIFGFFNFLGISLTEPNPPILLIFFSPFFFDDIFDINLTKLSAALMSTPLFLYVNRLLLITMKYGN